MSVIPKIVWPIPSDNRGNEFSNQEAILAHLGGESTGLYLIGRNGMWHGGIHITNATTPWCALSGKGPSEAVDFPVGYKLPKRNPPQRRHCGVGQNGQQSPYRGF